LESIERAVRSVCEKNLTAAFNFAHGLFSLRRHAEAKSLLRNRIPVARRALGEEHRQPLKMNALYAENIYNDPAATLDDLREAVTTLEDAERIARRVFGGTHPITVDIEANLRHSRAALRARDTAPPGSA